MTDHPAFRRALSGLADEVPGADADRAAAVRGRARRAVVRRRAAATALLGAAMLAGGLTAALAGSHTDALVTDPAEVPSYEATTAPAATASPTASASPTAAATATATSAGAPVAAGPTAAGPGGPTVELRLVGAAVTGQQAVFEVHVVDPVGPIAHVALSFHTTDPARLADDLMRTISSGGEGASGGVIDKFEDHCYPRNVPDTVGPTDRTLRFPVSFRVPGSFTAAVRVQTRSCAGGGGGWIMATTKGRWIATDTLAYTVTGKLWPQGPHVPRIEQQFERDVWEIRYNGRHPIGHGLQVRASDDAPVRSITVDWGDGSHEDVAFHAEEQSQTLFADCAHPNPFFPADQTVVARPDHEYAQPGRYTVTVTVVTAACDGSDPQTATSTDTWDWAPPPSSSASATPSASAT
ncbi:MAG TPA: hypothetical protein VFQ85_10140 [Mycobacteriales bacterium]|jgi:hypothetical protein|nr:hypothetical protein [Mycobacteriales bacterium]